MVNILTFDLSVDYVYTVDIPVKKIGKVCTYVLFWVIENRVKFFVFKQLAKMATQVTSFGSISLVSSFPYKFSH